MPNLTQQDLNVRLQLTNCCIGESTTNLLKKIKIGAKDMNCKLQNLQIIQNMLKYLKCYDIIDTNNNCLTEDQIVAIFDWISTKCKICFQNPGFNYE